MSSINNNIQQQHCNHSMLRHFNLSQSIADFYKPQFISFNAIKQNNLENRDPITSEKFNKFDELLLINGRLFLSSTIINHIIYQGSQHIQIPNNLTLWNNDSEYIELLKLLISSQIIDDSEKSILQQKIEQMKNAKIYIEKFERETGTKFGALLRHLRQLMKMQHSMGANMRGKEQELGFNSYLIIFQALPESIKKFIFPAYVYNPGDNQCINSSGKVFEQQISRLQSLDLIDDTQEEYSEERFQFIMQWFMPENITPLEIENTTYENLPIQALKTGVYRKNIKLKIVALPENTSLEAAIAYAIDLLKSKFDKELIEFYNLLSIDENKKNDRLHIANAIKNYAENTREQRKAFLIEYCKKNKQFLECFAYTVFNKIIETPSEETQFFEELKSDKLDRLIDHPACLLAFINSQIKQKLPPFATQDNSGEKAQIIFFEGAADAAYITPSILQIDNTFNLVVDFTENPHQSK